MPQKALEFDWLEIEDRVRAFESACSRGPAGDWADFLPACDDPAYLPVLGELVRVDMELAWRRGQRTCVADYAGRFPELMSDRELLAAVAFEEFRLHRAAGESPSASEFAHRYGVDTAAWTSGGPAAPAVAASLPTASAPPPDAGYMPQVGDLVLGFRLVEELGRGAVGRVFLAEQGELANRPVVLKFSRRLLHESDTLSQLQHTHIVPVFSVHRIGAWQALCMPYFGRTTLADVLTAMFAGGLPATGELFASTVRDRIAASTRSLASDNASARPSAAQETASDSRRKRGPGRRPIPWPAGGGSQVAGQLQSIGYVAAVLQIMLGTARGLAHAHQRGVVHCDLKPANILLSDELRPMLLDFNLSAATANHGPRRYIGGSLPYMAPEELAAFDAGPIPADPRADIYSFGVVLYELLSGCAAPTPADPSTASPAEWHAARLRRWPAPRRCNAAITPAVEAILNKCLAVDPAVRYPTAVELADDLQRHLSDLPLWHAANGSLAERLGKWRRRHPRLASATTAAAAAGVICAALAVWASVEHRQRNALEASALARKTAEELRQASLLLFQPDLTPQERKNGAALCSRIIRRHRASEANWWDSGPHRLLSEAERRRLREDVGRAFFLRAAESLHAGGRHSAASVAAALSDNAHAARNLAAQADAALAAQRRWLLRANSSAAPATGESAGSAAAGPPSDGLLIATGAYLEGRRDSAREQLIELTQQHPEMFEAWLLLGHCSLERGDFPGAISAYSVCAALAPNSDWAWFNRGVARLHRRDYALAEADFSRTLATGRRPAEALLNRGLARLALGKHRQAVNDFSRAIHDGRPSARLYLLRSRAKLALGDLQGAARDRELGLETQPQDAEDWVARGVARLSDGDKSQLAKALADFESALQVDPRRRSALENRAAVLSLDSVSLDEAIATLDTLIRLYPDYAAGKAGRAVLRARRGDFAGALHDADAALLLDARPDNLYRSACVRALASRQAPEMRFRAVEHLAAAFRQGYGREMARGDADLAPLHGDALFEKLLRDQGVTAP